MATGLFLSIRSELMDVTKQMERDMKLKVGHVSKYLDLELKQDDQLTHPAALILMTRALGGGDLRTVSMASVVQFIYLATKIHREVKEEPAFPVLIGDYLYTKFFSYLCVYNALQWLPTLSKVICQIHEGGIRRLESLRQDSPDISYRLKIIEMESASLMKEACVIAAQLAGAPGHLVQAAGEFGRNLGMAWGIQRCPWPDLPVDRILAQAQESLFLLPDGRHRHELMEMLRSNFRAC